MTFSAFRLTTTSLVHREARQFARGLKVHYERRVVTYSPANRCNMAPFPYQAEKNSGGVAVLLERYPNLQLAEAFLRRFYEIA